MKVSVIIPSYNRSRLLLESITSVMAQDYKKIEIVVVDDGSTDDTVAKLEEFLENSTPEESAKIKLIKQKNSGAPIARNLGFQASDGDCIVFMDSDDLLTPEGLAEGVAQLKRLDCDYVYMPVQHCDETGVPVVGGIVGGQFDSQPAEIAGYHWQTMGAIYRREVVEDVGPWNPELTGSQDWEYQARVKMSRAKGKFVDSIIGYWRTHELGRIGATTYNHRYVLSLERACVAIGEEASIKGLLDSRLKAKLFRRLIIHAVEAGAAGAFTDRNRLFHTAREFAVGIQVPLLVLISLIQIQYLDRCAFRAFSK